ncbi:hypothetical protein BDN72DRAFT_848536 [Pluteus cervinus]|uniref:Uncharacterized protein n=1 Tax=Pluteus cervinus TaxID=181527 RepID=A0ACD3AA56_9AGAR|nr:hypothetical protein BDN72DRAFT_848536 [Pluteus cervinus]
MGWSRTREKLSLRAIRRGCKKVQRQAIKEHGHHGLRFCVLVVLLQPHPRHCSPTLPMDRVHSDSSPVARRSGCIPCHTHGKIEHPVEVFDIEVVFSVRIYTLRRRRKPQKPDEQEEKQPTTTSTVRWDKHMLAARPPSLLRILAKGTVKVTEWDLAVSV